MKAFTHLAAFGAFAFATVTAPAQAQIVTLKPSVEHLDDEPTYLAALWPGERVNFYNTLLLPGLLRLFRTSGCSISTTTARSSYHARGEVAQSAPSGEFCRLSGDLRG